MKNSKILVNSGKEILQDKFGRVHDYLRMSLTERCNLRCFYCMPEEGIEIRPKSHFMRLEEILEIASIFVDLGVKKIRLTGGEPLIRKDIKEILEGLSKLPIEVGITTNGILVDKFLDVLKETGTKAINVSLDTLNREKQITITKRDYGDRIMNNIHSLIDQGFNLKINAVIIKGVNDDEIIDFIQWTKDLPVDVRFIEFMPFDGNKWNSDKKVSYKEMNEIIQNFYPASDIIRIEDQPNDTARNYKIRGYKGSYGLISPVSNPFCDTCNRIRLTADGKIKNCLFSSSETDLLSALREGKDIKPLIFDSVNKKFAEKGGNESFNALSKLGKNRSMITIGG